MPTLLQSWLANHQEYEAQDRKLAIYVGPGGNAGVNCGGILSALQATKSLLPSAHYFGSSVGAFSLMYTLIAQDYNSSTIFGRFYTDNRFFSPWRLLTKRPAINLDYVIHDVMTSKVPMEYAQAEASHIKLHALTTSATGYVDARPLTGVPQEQAIANLRATASMPLIGRTHNIDNTAGWDGWLIEHLLLEYLQAEGFTDVVWISNTPLPTCLPEKHRWLQNRITKKIKHYNPVLANLIKDRLNAGNFLTNSPEGLNLEVIAPPLRVSSTCRNPAKLFHALGTSFKTMAAYLGQPNLSYPPEWEPWHLHMP